MAHHTENEDTKTVAQTGRRGVLKAAVAGLGVAIASTRSIAQTPEVKIAGQPGISTGAFHTGHQPAPLAFDAGRLKGLSKQLIESHWANNYGGSVRALNEINKRLAAALAAASTPAFVYNDLKREHLLRNGSVILHELYFDNLGGNGRPAADVRQQLAAAFGSYDRWQSEYRKIAAGLGGGSGWVVLGYNRHFRCFENYWMADHMHGPAATAPLLVLDMYEHSYHMDYGAATARYIDAFFANVNWEVVAARISVVT